MDVDWYQVPSVKLQCRAGSADYLCVELDYLSNFALASMVMVTAGLVFVSGMSGFQF